MSVRSGLYISLHGRITRNRLYLDCDPFESVDSLYTTGKADVRDGFLTPTPLSFSQQAVYSSHITESTSRSKVWAHYLLKTKALLEYIHDASCYVGYDSAHLFRTLDCVIRHERYGFNGNIQFPHFTINWRDHGLSDIVKNNLKRVI